MKKLPRLYWIIGTVLTIAGISVMTAGAFQIKADNRKAEISLIEDICPAESVQSVKIDVSGADVMIKQAEDEKISLSLPDNKQIKYTCKENTLSVYSKENVLFREIQFISIGLTTKSQICLYLPEKQYQELKLSVGHGTITLSDLDVKNLIMDNGAGDVQLNQIQCGEKSAIYLGAGNLNAENCNFSAANIENGAGDISLNQVQFSSDSVFDLGAGDISLNQVQFSNSSVFDLGFGILNAENCMFREIKINNGAGDILFSDTCLEGNAHFYSGAGDIQLGLVGNSRNYDVDCSDTIGSVAIQNNSVKSFGSGTAEYQIKVETTGDVNISFTE